MDSQDPKSFSRPQRQMFDVSSLNLKCATCGADIKELPFQPSSDRPVYCQPCNRARKEQTRGSQY